MMNCDRIEKFCHKMPEGGGGGRGAGGCDRMVEWYGMVKMCKL
jgi:hypothetical protein